jgi:hypothetical protein
MFTFKNVSCCAFRSIFFGLAETHLTELKAKSSSVWESQTQDWKGLHKANQPVSSLQVKEMNCF